MEEEEEARDVELSTIAAIYSEELKLDDRDRYSFTIELPVSLDKPVVVKFPAIAEAAPALQPIKHATTNGAEESHELSNLPALQIRIRLPRGYPAEKPPFVDVSTSPPWLPVKVIKKLEDDVSSLWEEMGRDQVVFAYIDNVQQSVDTLFGLVDDRGTLEVGLDHKIAILDYDINAKRKAFEKGTFDCGICLDPKKGAVCHRMIDCGHVFCVQCLQDFYNNAITEGDVASVRCLEPGCAEKRDAAGRDVVGGRRRKPKTFINPSELLEIPLEEDMVRRYVNLKYKTELESDKNTVYCPRSWCQGAARSKKHRKPEGFDLAEELEGESDPEDEVEAKKSQKWDSNDLLAICEECSFAFCTRCRQSWHGEFKYCIPQERKDAITEEEKASLEYLKSFTTPCPTCAAPCQKTQGCNHMRCFRCQTHFCYLCSAWLNPGNPYQHFNIQPGGEVNSCFMRLWELEGGDGDDVGIGYAGGNGRREDDGQELPQVEVVDNAAAAHAEVDNDDDDTDVELDFQDQAVLQVLADLQPPVLQNGVPAPGQAEPERRIAVAREGPLVLRIEGGGPPARGRGQVQQRLEPLPPRRRGQAANEGRRGAGRGVRGNVGVAANRGNPRQAPRGRGRRDNGAVAQGFEVLDPLAEDGLNQADEAWIRHFVQLALNDQEHLVGLDSDEDD